MLISVLGALEEGLTMQYDNLLSTTFYFTLFMYAHNFLMDLSYNDK
jgi:hypothetical protein